MRVLNFAMIFLGLNYGHISGFCTEETNEEKIYVPFENITLQENNIFVFLEQQWIAVEQLCSDKNGLYLKSVSTWTCPSCGYKNKKGNGNQCAFCGLSYLCGM